MKVIDYTDCDKTKLLSFLKEYLFKPYSKYLHDNEILSKILLKKIDALENNTEINLFEDEDKYHSIMTIKRSEWDSNHFQREIGKIDLLLSISNNATKSLLKAKSDILNKFDITMVNVSTNDLTHTILQQFNFKIMSTNVTYSFKFKNDLPHIQKSNILILPMNENNIPEVLEIAKLSFSQHRISNDHFHADPFFSSKKSDQLYVKWIENSFKQKNPIFIAKLGNITVGFLGPYLINEEAKEFGCSIGHIPISAIHPHYFGRGIYTALIRHSLEWFQKKVDYEELGSQIDNVAVQRAWQENGFKIINSHYILHFHKK